MSRNRAAMFLVVAGLLGAAGASAARAENVLTLYGGYALNDDDRGADDEVVYGLRWGVVSPVGGGEVILDLNQGDEIEFNSVVLSTLLNFVSTNRRAKDGLLLTNSFSSFISLGIGATEVRSEAGDDHTFLTFEYGVGLQARFTRRVGLRLDVMALDSSAGEFRNIEGTTGITFSW